MCLLCICTDKTLSTDSILQVIIIVIIIVVVTPQAVCRLTAKLMKSANFLMSSLQKSFHFCFRTAVVYLLLILLSSSRQNS